MISLWLGEAKEGRERLFLGSRPLSTDLNLLFPSSSLLADLQPRNFLFSLPKTCPEKGEKRREERGRGSCRNYLKIRNQIGNLLKLRQQIGGKRREEGMCVI